jgi:hypothetical protein
MKILINCLCLLAITATSLIPIFYSLRLYYLQYIAVFVSLSTVLAITVIITASVWGERGKGE